MVSAKNLDYLVLSQAASFRSGITLPFQIVENTFSDIEGIFNVSVPEDSVQPWKSASGSISRDRNQAIVGAVAEAMERYSAAVISFPIKKLQDLKGEKVITHSEFSLFSEEQYNSSDFPWRKFGTDEAFFGEVFSVYDNEKFWVPQELIGLGTKSDEALIPSTSTGLAAHFDKYKGLLLAIEELLERDALTVYWLNSLGGREIRLEERYVAPITKKFGQVLCFDITQIWNPYPVVIVCGYLKQRNKKRISMGVACRETYEQAIEKAYLEWIQGAIFAGFYDIYHPDIKLEDKKDLIDFDEHAVYYTMYPDLWEQVPLLAKKFAYKKRIIKKREYDTKAILGRLLDKLKGVGIRIFYRDITLPDVREAGLNVIRVLSPELSLIHGDERAPFLGGRINDVKWRYPDLVNQIEFPNKYPHPLG
ncbi:MAG: YcaO-like family protein [Patescibacteria group bacterium]|nr:YcaO-like family protein [Patescibacteria group bacterium]